jgi:hypothetical protein
MTDTTYNGWKNWETWNVALWLGNDRSLYKTARRFVHYKDLAQALVDCGTPVTPDGASYNDPDLDAYALDEWLMDEQGEDAEWCN